jgi:uncharacterized 2Fe-2S/4Fe-4S cluster protein (DUF4445 family)
LAAKFSEHVKILITQNGKTTELEYDAPVSLADALKNSGVPHRFPCGGKGNCGKCLVYVSGALSPLSRREEFLLTKEQVSRGLRLACLTEARGDVFVTPPEMEDEQILTSGCMPSFERSPWGLADGDKTVYGVAVDIGTTTVAAYLYDLASGVRVAEQSALNPQRAFGADVISRMERSIAGEGNALRRMIAECINMLISKLCAAVRAEIDAVTSAVITGNTAMLFFLCGEPVQSLAGLPFIPSKYFGEYFSPAELDISLPANSRIYLPRCISAYVGADITTGIIATELLKFARPVLLVDIGTNGEMVLQTGGKLLACSTAAGPAFEGAGIRMGNGAVPGAVKSVMSRGGKLVCETIGGARPESICGSGIVDTIAVLLELGAIAGGGRVSVERAGELGVLCEIDGETALRIAGEVILTQRDIRAVQLAKAAICAGMRTLLHRGGVSRDDLGMLFIAGGFGSFMDTRSAAAIGLIIPELAPKARSVGNSAGSGAAMLLQSRALLEVSERVAARTETIDLAADKYFMEKYIDCMSFEWGE